MTSSKLSPTEKQEVIRQYRQPRETTITLAEAFGVSPSTIGRVIKKGLPRQEYERLVDQKKRQTRFKPGTASESASTADTPQPALVETAKRTKVPTKVAPQPAPDRGAQLELLDEDARESEYQEAEVFQATGARSEDSTLAYNDYYDNSLDDDLEASDFPRDDLEDEFEAEEDLGDFEDGEDEGQKLTPTANLQVRPLTNTVVPKICYIVVDRMAELITRPLQDFGELGQIPETEIGAKTLPVFDNHRMAKRFSKHNQWVIRIPDGQVFQKVTSSLQAKGITRLLIDGCIYTLETSRA